jgi:hypothetical protein
MVHIFQYALYKTLFSSRFLIVSVFTFLLVHFYLKLLLDFAGDFNLGVYPAALPFLFSDQSFVSLGILLLVFLFSGSPLNDEIQKGILMRSKSGAWCHGQILAIATTVFLWLVEIQLFVCLQIGKLLDFSGWGKAWGTCASGKSFELGYDMNLSVSQDIITKYTPAQAILLCGLFVFLTGVVFGEIIFVLDGITGHPIGEILLSVWGLAYLVISNIRWFDQITFLQKFSPKNWLSINRYATGSSGLYSNLILICVIIVFLFASAHILVRKKIIMPE